MVKEKCIFRYLQFSLSLIFTLKPGLDVCSTDVLRMFYVCSTDVLRRDFHVYTGQFC